MENQNLEIAHFENEDGFKDGWYIIEVGSDRQVLWMSECFDSKADAKEYLRLELESINSI